MRKTVYGIVVAGLTFVLGLSVNHPRSGSFEKLKLTRATSNQAGHFDNSSSRKAVLVVDKSRTINHRGISFAVDPALASGVIATLVAENSDGKPGDVCPEHLNFEFSGYPKHPAAVSQSATLAVFPLAAFRSALTVAGKRYEAAVAYPENFDPWEAYLDEEVRTLKALLKERPSKHAVETFIVKARGRHSLNSYRSTPQMPFLPMGESSQVFIGRPTYLVFKNGTGVLFLTEQQLETAKISNEGLEYVFQGLSSDGKYYVSAAFPIAAAFLPSGSEPEMRLWMDENYLLPLSSLKYRRYLRSVLPRLESLPAEEFQPSLKAVERLITSLELREP